MPAAPLVAAPWRRWCLAGVIVAAAVVAVIGLAVHNRATTRFDTWAARPLFEHIDLSTGLVLLRFSSPMIAIGVLAVIVVVAALLRNWAVATLAVVGPTVAIVLTEVVLKPLVHRHIDGAAGAYPSGHETGLVSLLVVLLVLVPRARPNRAAAAVAVALLIAWTVIGAVGLVRGYYHFVSDTIGGIGVAVACVLATALLIDAVGARLRRSDPAGAGQFT